MLKMTTRIGLFLLLMVLVAGGGFGRNQAQASPTAANLIAHWEFEEGSGFSAADSTANAYDGTITGATWSADVAPAATGTRSLEFDGNDYIDSFVFDINNDFTVSAWVNPDNTNNRAILSKHTSSGGNQFIFGMYRDLYQINIGDDYFEAGNAVTGCAASAGDWRGNSKRDAREVLSQRRVAVGARIYHPDRRRQQWQSVDDWARLGRQQSYRLL